MPRSLRGTVSNLGTGVHWRGMTVRLPGLLAALLLALAVPSAALGQGAGDEQYHDPFGSGQNNSGEEPPPDPDTPTSSDPTRRTRPRSAGPAGARAVRLGRAAAGVSRPGRATAARTGADAGCSRSAERCYSRPASRCGCGSVAASAAGRA